MKARHFSAAVALGALLSLALGVLAQSGGYPTRIRAQSIGVGVAPPPGVGGIAADDATFDDVTIDALTLTTVNGIAPSDFARLSVSPTFTAGYLVVENAGLGGVGLRHSAAATDEKLYETISINGQLLFRAPSDDYLLHPVWLSVDRTGTTIDSVSISAAAITGNGVDMTPLVGTFTATLDNGCSNDPAVTMYYYKIGAHVTISSPSNWLCTSDGSSKIATAAIPAALRPARDQITGTSFSYQKGGTNQEGIAGVFIDADGDLHLCLRITDNAGTVDGRGACQDASWATSDGHTFNGFTAVYLTN